MGLINDRRRLLNFSENFIDTPLILHSIELFKPES